MLQCPSRFGPFELFKVSAARTERRRARSDVPTCASSSEDYGNSNGEACDEFAGPQADWPVVARVIWFVIHYYLFGGSGLALKHLKDALAAGRTGGR
jgi:hypothetical protein